MGMFTERLENENYDLKDRVRELEAEVKLLREAHLAVAQKLLETQDRLEAANKARVELGILARRAPWVEGDLILQGEHEADVGQIGVTTEYYQRQRKILQEIWAALKETGANPELLSRIEGVLS